jgi:hypothetical protein
MPIQRLKELVNDAQSAILELQSAPVRRDLDIATDHQGEEELIHGLIRTRGDATFGRWHQLETIYCSSERCCQCPHGPFWFRYSRNKRKKTVSVKFAGFPALSEETLDWMRSTVELGVPYVVSLGVPSKERENGVSHSEI